VYVVSSGLIISGPQVGKEESVYVVSSGPIYQDHKLERRRVCM
jgi:hypothetical protein